MKYEYPKTFQVGTHVFHIFFPDGCYVTCDAESVADCHVPTGEIRIATKTAKGGNNSISYLEENLIHEAIEAINKIFGTNLEHDNIERIAQGMTQVLNSMGIHLIEEK